MATRSVTPDTDPEHDPGFPPATPARGRWIRPTTALGVFGLAVAAFVLSYDALHALALASGIRPGLAWIWPLVVDGFIVVASLSVLAANRARSAAYPWALVGTFSALSIGFNIAHAPDALTAQAVAAIPPLALMLAFELLMRQIPTVARSDRTATRPHPAPDPAESAPFVRLPATMPDLDPTEPGAPTDQAGPDPTSTLPVRDQARQVFAERLAAGEPVTGAALARALGISDRYGQRLLAELRAETHDHPGTRNGHPLDRDPAAKRGQTGEEANGR